MSEHFIKTIEIKNFKCFEDFKAEGFGRVNLIGGKNNVGKTAFMEACYINSIVKNAKDYILASSNLIYFRNYINLIHTTYSVDIEFFLKKPSDTITINSNIQTTLYKLSKINSVITNEYFVVNQQQEVIPRGSLEQLAVDELWNRKNHFIPSSQIEDQYLNTLHDTVRLNMYEDTLNQNISELFGLGFQKFLMKEKKPLIYNNENWYSLASYGDGIKRFIAMISALYASKDGYLYLDEIENGIHYTNLDKLWEIILTISKQQNVQVFATTHSKECIESYARVAKKLEDNEIGFIELGINKKGRLDSIVMNAEQFLRHIGWGNEVRGW